MKQWVECKVSPGMFSDERLVEFDDCDRSFFVKESMIRRSNDGCAEVEVTILEKGALFYVHTSDGLRELASVDQETTCD